MTGHAQQRRYIITFDNWLSGSFASRAVRLASVLSKNQRVVVSQDITTNTVDVSSLFVRAHDIYK